MLYPIELRAREGSMARVNEAKQAAGQRKGPATGAPPSLSFVIRNSSFVTLLQPSPQSDKPDYRSAHHDDRPLITADHGTDDEGGYADHHKRLTLRQAARSRDRGRRWCCPWLNTEQRSCPGG